MSKTLSGFAPPTFAQALEAAVVTTEAARLEHTLAAWRDRLLKRYGRVHATTLVRHATIVLGCKNLLARGGNGCFTA